MNANKTNKQTNKQTNTNKIQVLRRKIAWTPRLLHSDTAHTYFGRLLILRSYVSKIFLTLRQNHFQAHGHMNRGQPNQISARNITRYRKTVSSALWVQLMLVFCYTPHGIVEILILRSGLSPLLIVARTFSVTLVFLNSSLNPILYCWKIREVRQAVKDLVKNLFCSST